MDLFSKVFTEFVTTAFMFYVLAFWLWGMWDLSSPTRDWTQTPCTGRWSLNHWTAREVLLLFYFHFCCLCFWCHIQNHHQDRCHRGSMVSGLTFKSFIHFEFRGNDDPAVENFPSGANIACWNIPNISYHSFSLKHLPVLKFYKKHFMLVTFNPGSVLYPHFLFTFRHTTEGIFLLQKYLPKFHSIAFTSVKIHLKLIYFKDLSLIKRYCSL